MKKITTLVYSLVVLTGFLAQDCLACDCQYQPAPESFETVDIVFIGKVIQIDKSDPPMNAAFEVKMNVTFEVENILKGVPSDRFVIASYVTDCDYPFWQDGTFMVYANNFREQLIVGSCSGTMPITSNTQPNLEKLRADLAGVTQTKNHSMITTLVGWIGLVFSSMAFWVKRSRGLKTRRERVNAK